MLEVAPEEAGAGQQQAPLRRRREPMRLSGEDLDLVAHVVFFEQALQLVGFANRDRAVLIAVQHEHRGRRWRKARFHPGRQAA